MKPPYEITSLILKLIASEFRIREQKLSNFYLILLFYIVLVLFGFKFFKIWQSGSINRKKTFLVTGATLMFSAVIYRICIFLC